MPRHRYHTKAPKPVISAAINHFCASGMNFEVEHDTKSFLDLLIIRIDLLPSPFFSSNHFNNCHRRLHTSSAQPRCSVMGVSNMVILTNCSSSGDRHHHLQHHHCASASCPSIIAVLVWSPEKRLAAGAQPPTLGYFPLRTVLLPLEHAEDNFR